MVQLNTILLEQREPNINCPESKGFIKFWVEVNSNKGRRMLSFRFLIWVLRTQGFKNYSLICIIYILFIYFTRKKIKKDIGKQNTLPETDLFHLNLIKLNYTKKKKRQFKCPVLNRQQTNPFHSFSVTHTHLLIFPSAKKQTFPLCSTNKCPEGYGTTLL